MQSTCADACSYNQVPCCREIAQTQYSRPYDTLSCHLHTAIWLVKCQSMLTQTQQSSDLPILPFDVFAHGAFCPSGGHWLHQEDLVSLIIPCRNKTQAGIALEALLSARRSCVGDVMPFNHQKYFETILKVLDASLGMREASSALLLISRALQKQ